MFQLRKTDESQRLVHSLSRMEEGQLGKIAKLLAISAMRQPIGYRLTSESCALLHFNATAATDFSFLGSRCQDSSHQWTQMYSIGHQNHCASISDGAGCLFHASCLDRHSSDAIFAVVLECRPRYKWLYDLAWSLSHRLFSYIVVYTALIHESTFSSAWQIRDYRNYLLALLRWKVTSSSKWHGQAIRSLRIKPCS